MASMCLLYTPNKYPAPPITIGCEFPQPLLSAVIIYRQNYTIHRKIHKIKSANSQRWCPLLPPCWLHPKKKYDLPIQRLAGVVLQQCSLGALTVLLLLLFMHVGQLMQLYHGVQ